MYCRRWANGCENDERGHEFCQARYCFECKAETTGGTTSLVQVDLIVSKIDAAIASVVADKKAADGNVSEHSINSMEWQIRGMILARAIVSEHEYC